MNQKGCEYDQIQGNVIHDNVFTYYVRLNVFLVMTQKAWVPHPGNQPYLPGILFIHQVYYLYNVRCFDEIVELLNE